MVSVGRLLQIDNPRARTLVRRHGSAQGSLCFKAHVAAPRKDTRMMADFERSKQDVRGRSILITSWFDDTAHTWRASAPAYVHLLPHGDEAQTGRPSRKAAIDRILAALSSQFDHMRR